MEERLIAAVMTFPELYNPAMREYKDGNRRAVAWRCIALQVPISEEDAKKKWRNLRDRYRKEHMAEKKRRSRSAEGPRRTWKFMPLLHFLDPYVKDRPTSSNMRHGEGASETDSFSASEPSPILSDAEVPSCSTATNPDISLVMRPVTSQENFCELTPQENFCGVTPGPVMPFECPRMPTPGPSQPLQRPCPATPEPLQSPSKPLHEGSRPSRPKRGHTELSEFEAQVMNTLSSRPDEEEHFGLSLAATLRRLPPSKRRLLRCHIEQLVYEVEFGDGLCNRGWGIQQETKAKEAYIETMSSKHLNFDVTPPPLDSTFLRSTLILAHHLMGRCLVTVVALCAWRSNVPTWQKTRHC
ncbi:uncharacterized protein LOC118231887 isoform X1 [Anguilla anguilla]|uniref:uncharacterized protein LOC118231887 isoform X1 n=1 Tax=Anguilla anguilla TaxID=7936 RepID=UPI0015AF7A3C|nr:uncharacterized protein LOC118231887 isoform X1 [Anguilla anguilla]